MPFFKRLGNGWAYLKIKNPNYHIVRVFVRIIGLEPTRLAAPDPKSGMSTNFTISAKFVSANINISIKLQSFKSKKFNYFLF